MVQKECLYVKVLEYKKHPKSQSTKTENKGNSNAKRHEECEDILMVGHSHKNFQVLRGTGSILGCIPIA